MARKPYGLIDTGAILAIVDRDEPWHSATVDAIGRLRLPLATSAAVLTELFHLAPDSRVTAAAWKFLETGGVTVLAIDDSDMPDLHQLMDRYRDRPMDFADATLVHLGSRESLTTILTIDHDDFETYRLARGRKFRIVPQRGSDH